MIEKIVEGKLTRLHQRSGRPGDQASICDPKMTVTDAERREQVVGAMVAVTRFARSASAKPPHKSRCGRPDRTALHARGPHTRVTRAAPTRNLLSARAFVPHDYNYVFVTRPLGPRIQTCSPETSGEAPMGFAELRHRSAVANQIAADIAEIQSMGVKPPLSSVVANIFRGCRCERPRHDRRNCRLHGHVCDGDQCARAAGRTPSSTTTSSPAW